MHQNNTNRLVFGIVLDIAQDLGGVGVAGGGVLGAHVPVDPGIAFLLSLGFDLLHDLPSAVSVADRVGAAAGEPQPVDSIHIDIVRQRGAQSFDIQPEVFGAAVNAGIGMGRAVQGNLVARSLNIR